ncbi:hypothetical protein BGP_0435 [Beggiatoa sp. PS]|nr:hypothetical protein BGP_0435 [Beggiatoa sp. PS]
MAFFMVRGRGGVEKIRFFVGSKIDLIFAPFIKNNQLLRYFSLPITNYQFSPAQGRGNSYSLFSIFQIQPQAFSTTGFINCS